MDWRCDSSRKYLLCKHEALSSDPSPIRGKQKNKKGQGKEEKEEK
jgi:hypothetical protein